MEKQLASEKVVLSAPFSFHGSAARIWKITRSDNSNLKWLILIPAALCLISFAWIIVLMWYLFLYVFLGLFFIPYRLIRRGSRKRKMENLRHHELLDALDSKNTAVQPATSPENLDESK